MSRGRGKGKEKKSSRRHQKPERTETLSKKELEKQDPFFQLEFAKKDLKSKSLYWVEMDDLYRLATQYNEEEKKDSQRVADIQEANTPLSIRKKLILLSLYREMSKEKKAKQSDHLERLEYLLLRTTPPLLKRIKTTNESTLTIDNDELERMKLEYPFSFMYQKLRNILLNSGIDKKSFDAFYRGLEKYFNKFSASEQSLVDFEQVILDVYYQVRINAKKVFDQKLADKLETFLKSPNGLNLIAKYNEIKIPHEVSPGMNAPDIRKKIPNKRRVAIVDIEQLRNGVYMTDNEQLSKLDLLNKLKFEFDEVVITGKYIVKEKDKDLMTYLNVLFSNQVKMRDCISDSSSEYKDKDKDNKAYLESLDKQAAQRKITVTYFSEIKPLISEDLKEEAKANLTQNLVAALKKYRIQRRIEAGKDNSSYHSFFGRVFGSSAEEKDLAVDKIIKALQNKSVKITPEDIKALQHDRLGKLMEHYKKSWPEAYKNALSKDEKKNRI